MDSDKFKISEQNMQGKGVSAQPNPMELPEAEAKAVFDQLVKEVVVPKFNEVLDALVPIDLTSDEDKPISTATQAALDLKVDKEKKTGSATENKVLSDNNYSDSEKIKLSGIADHANNYVHPATHDASMITGLATLAHNVVDGNNTGAVRTVGAKSNYTMGSHAFAEGVNTVASGVYSHAEGNTTAASGSNSHAEGQSTIASNYTAHAEGNGTTASGSCSHAEGSLSKASGHYSHAEGTSTIAEGVRSHAEGDGTLVSGNYGGHAEGSGSIAVTDKCVFKILSADKDAKKFVIDTNYFPYGTTPFDNLSVGEEILVRNPVYTTASFPKYTIASIDNVEHSIIINETISLSYFSPDFFVCFAVGDTALYQSAHAEGRNVLASGYSSHAEGERTVASGHYSHAEGGNTIASGAYAHAEGSNTTASGSYSHAEGSNTTASGSYSHAEGSSTTASGSYSHAEGTNTNACGSFSHAEGFNTVASGSYSHAEGNNTYSHGIASHSEGTSTIVSGNYGGHAEGNGSIAVTNKCVFKISSVDASNKKFVVDIGYFSYGTTPFNYLSVGNEILVRNTVYTSSAPYKYTIASIDAVAKTITINEAIPSTNFNPDFFVCFATGDSSTYLSAHAEGRNVLASGYSSHAEGDRTVASGGYSHAEGNVTKASGSCSHAEGDSSSANGYASHAEGVGTVANGFRTHAEGSYTTAETYALHTQGQYNTVNAGSPTAFSTSQNAFVIGNGTSSNAKSNCFRVDYSGNVYGLAAFNSTGADYAEYFEWEDGNPNAEDRRGKFVTLNGEKIKIAQEGDFILGVVSSNPAIVGNHPSEVWKDMYLTDVWGDYVMEWRTIPAQTEMVTKNHDEVVSEDVVIVEDVVVSENVVVIGEDGKKQTFTEERIVPEERTVTQDRIITTTEEVEQVVVEEHQEYLPVINPDYDPNQTYISRDKRKEWATIGMMGQLIVYTDGSCIVNGFCKCGNGGIATTATEGYRVLKVIDDNKILILLK